MSEKETSSSFIPDWMPTGEHTTESDKNIVWLG